jgi:glycosyl transferase family 25
MSPADWDFVPVVVCISLRERSDRTIAAALEFHRVGLGERVLFYRPKRDLENGKRGCYNSHREVCTWARSRGLAWVLIFEDDVEFDLDPERLSLGIRNAREALLRLSSRTWHVLHLGHLPYLMTPVEPWNTGLTLYRTLSACAHAYFASRSFMDWIADRPFGPNTRGLDFYTLWCCRTFAVYPMIAYQRPMGSDVSHSLPITERLNRRDSLRAMERVQPPLAKVFLFSFVGVLAAAVLWVTTRVRK